MDLGWCNYELGRFYDGKRKVVCIKNTDISEPPPPFQPYQAYNADEAGIGKFIDELFVKGTFTDGEPINANVGQITQPLYERAQRVARELAQKFAHTRDRTILRALRSRFTGQRRGMFRRMVKIHERIAEGAGAKLRGSQQAAKGPSR